MKTELELSRHEKILLTLYKISGKSKKSVRYEDIVVALFKTYPEDFHLKGYKEYPDSGDIVHKPLYEFRKRGYLEAGNKMFALTDMGVEKAENILEATKYRTIKKSSSRLPHYLEKEINRISHLESFSLFAKGVPEKILDTDFYDYLDVTVRTPKNVFIGRLKTLENTCKELEKIDKEKYKVLLDFHDLMTSKFDDVIVYIKNLR